jgi:hypothetical protein
MPSLEVKPLEIDFLAPFRKEGVALSRPWFLGKGKNQIPL